MTEERLSGLALMKINRKYCEKVCSSPQKMRMLVQQFHQFYSRRMKLPFVLAD